MYLGPPPRGFQKGGGGVFLLSVQNSGEYISTMFGCV